MSFAALFAKEFGPPNVLEWSFLGILGLMTVAIGAIAAAVLVRIVEPRGLKVFMQRLRGRA